MHGNLRFLCLSHLLYGMCVKIFVMNKYISRATQQAKILLTDNIQSGGSCSVNYYSYTICLSIYIVLYSKLLITWAERQVKDSRRSGISQSCSFWTKLGRQSLLVFGLSGLFDEVRAELVRDILKSLSVLWFILWFIRGRKNYYFGLPGVWTDLPAARQIRGDSKLRD